MDLTARYHIVLENRLGCELDGRFATNEDDIKGAILSLTRECEFSAGDVIRVIELEG